MERTLKEIAKESNIKVLVKSPRYWPGLPGILISDEGKLNLVIKDDITLKNRPLIIFYHDLDPNFFICGENSDNKLTILGEIKAKNESFHYNQSDIIYQAWNLSIHSD